MANETHGHEYRTMTDNPSDGEKAGRSWFMSGCLFVLSTPFAMLAITAFIFEWNMVKWIVLAITLLLLILAISERLSFCKLPKKLDAYIGRPSPRLLEAQRAKDFLGFDFGGDFKLRTTGSHDYAEILIDFEESEFKALKDFCKRSTESIVRVDTEQEITITEIKNYLVIDEGSSYSGKESITKAGYTKIESYYEPSLSKDEELWITSRLKLEIDYEYRTLKMSWTGW